MSGNVTETTCYGLIPNINYMSSKFIDFNNMHRNVNHTNFTMTVDAAIRKATKSPAGCCVTLQSLNRDLTVTEP